MKFTYNWLKDFVDIDMTPDKLARGLTMAGLEVGSIVQAGNDLVFEVEITSNRPDWLSVIGIAREAAAITGKTIKKEKDPSGKIASRGRTFSIEIEDKKDCPLYTARWIEGVKVGPSPDWLKLRLELIGCRSINSVVDITNYVMFTRGQPLHAFDMDKLASPKIIVRRAKAGEKILLIDGQQKALDKDILIIADEKSPVAVAGVMGGKDTEVTEGTKNILLESAVFDQVLVRRGRRKLAISSESSYRFERCVDLAGTGMSSAVAGRMIRDISSGSECLYKESNTIRPKLKSLDLDVIYAQKLLGMDKLARGTAIKILTSLGFAVRPKGKNSILVTVPSFRSDVGLKEDLIEEIARIYGYENIKTTLPSIIPQAEADPKRVWVSRVKDTLAGLGLNEAITPSLISRDLLKGVKCAAPVEVENPLSKEQEILRPALIPSLLKCVSYNLNQKQDYVAIFEVSDIFTDPAGSAPVQELTLGIAICGTRPLWFSGGHAQDKTGYLHLKGILGKLLECLRFKPGDYSFDMDTASCGINISIKGVLVGKLQTASKEALENFDIKNENVYVAQIQLDKILENVNPERKFTAFPKYPGITRDISLVLKEEVMVSQIMGVISSSATGFFQGAEVTDFYKGKQIEPGFKGITVSLRYSSRERTLTEAEVNPVHSVIVNALKEKLQARVR